MLNVYYKQYIINNKVGSCASDAARGHYECPPRVSEGTHFTEDHLHKNSERSATTALNQAFI